MVFSRILLFLTCFILKSGNSEMPEFEETMKNCAVQLKNNFATSRAAISEVSQKIKQTEKSFDEN